MALDLVDQVARHRARERFPPNGDANVGAGAREIERRLSGRVPSTDDEDGPSRARLCFHLRRGVVDADAFEIAEPIERQAVVARAGGDDDRLRRDGLAVVEADLVQPAARRQRDRARAELHANPELLCLQNGSCRELFTGQTGRKAEIVLDPSRGARLAPERGVLGERRRQPSEAP
jgi:hypothetical protein